MRVELVMRVGAAIAFCAVLLVVLSPRPSTAIGLDGLHGKVQVGASICFTDHQHRGGSRQMPTRDAAITDAIRSWTSLVVLEYGSRWSDFRRSVAQQITCNPAAAGPQGRGWVCNIVSRPCMPL